MSGYIKVFTQIQPPVIRPLAIRTWWVPWRNQNSPAECWTLIGGSHGTRISMLAHTSLSPRRASIRSLQVPYVLDQMRGYT
jgi:hypothetical protein